MPFRIAWTRRAGKDLKRLTRVDRKWVLARVSELSSTPRPHDCKRLRGIHDLYRIRVGRYRVLYQIEDRVRVVLVCHVRGRDTAYKRTGR